MKTVAGILAFLGIVGEYIGFEYIENSFDTRIAVGGLVLLGIAAILHNIAEKNEKN